MVDQSPGPVEPALVELVPDLPGTDSLTVRISRRYADDLVELLESHQLRYSKVVYASGGPNLAIYAVYSAAGALVGLGGFSGLAKVLTAFFNRHQGKRFVVNGDEISAEGVSFKDAQHWIELVLEKQAELEARRAAPPTSSTTQPRTPLGPP